MAEKQPSQQPAQAVITGQALAEEIHKCELELTRIKAAETDLRERRQAVQSQLAALQHVQSLQREPQTGEA